jgi:hypothetical protein
VPLLDDVAAAAAAYREAVKQREQARERLREKVRVARDEGISFAAIARAAGVSLERARQLYAGR